MLNRLLNIPYPWELGLMLLTLHAALLAEPGSGWALAAMMAHYGLFLIWQPIWRTEQRLSPAATLLFIVVGIVLLTGVNWWLLAFWHALLIGLLGGRVFSSQARQERIAFLLAMAYLLGMLLLWVEPRILGKVSATENINWLAQYVLPIFPANVLLLRIKRDKEVARSLDFFYSLMLFLLVVILVLGSFAIERISQLDYSLILLRVLFSIAGVLLALSWLWDPRAGFTGLGQLLSRYLLSVGMPFEQWLQRVATSADTARNSADFLDAAIIELSQLPWVSGGTWHTDGGNGTFGEASIHRADFIYHDFRLNLYTRSQLSPALTLHVKLLVQILGEFYESKRREEQMHSAAYMRAVYETGARLTHDIKNLLQSLSVLCSAAERAGNQANLVALIQRQLPQLSQRLQLTLDKLQVPQTAQLETVNATFWWIRLRERYRDTGIVMTAKRIPPDEEVPVELFDSVLDNLLQNAIDKRRDNSKVKISVTLLAADNGITIKVEDTGAAIPEEIANQMFKSILPSHTGLGIGLYHAARQAEFLGYDLQLVNNEDGAVRFLLGPSANPSKLAVGV
jgi:signal transduction histidine kinase